MRPADLLVDDDVLPLGQLFLRAVARDPGKEALVFPDVRLTYAALADRAWEIASGLVGLGVGAGQHVGVLMTNHPDLVATYYGTLLAGATAVPINARYRTVELEHLVRDADLTALVTADHADAHVDFAGLLHAALPGLAESDGAVELSLPDHPRLRRVVLLGTREAAGMVTAAEFAEAAARAGDDAVRRRSDAVRVRDIALILYTSGTTAAPRGAMLTHEAFGRGWMATGRTFRTTAADRHWSALPLFHVTALGCLTWVHGNGATFFSDYTVDAGRAVRCLADERITEFYPAYPPVMESIVNHPDFAAADLHAMKAFLNVAPPELLARFQARIPNAVQLTTYGQTEAGCVTVTRMDDPLEARLGTCGTCQPGMELRVADELDRPVPPGTPGELQFRGFNAFSGYYNHPEKTREAFAPDGWVRTGDLGWMDEQGRSMFLGRIAETLKVGGENVAPQEIEAQLATHPAVSLVAVVGIPDPRLLTVAAAFVELAPGATATEAELIAHCRGRIASFKVPRVVRFLRGDEWPMSTTKVQRTKLRERLVAELGLDG